MPTSIPGVVTALTAMITTALAAEPTYVVRGPVGEYAAGETLVVADKVTGVQEWGALGGRRRNETFDVECSIWVEAGDDDIAARTARAYDLFELIENAISVDPALGQPAENNVRAAPTNTEMTPGIDPDKGGTGVELKFTIGVAATVYNQGAQL